MTLIGIAIGVFVVIVSAQVFHEWPIADTGADAARSGVAPAKALGSPAGGEATAATGIDPALRAVGRKAAVANPARQNRTDRGANGAADNSDVSGSATAVEPTPSTGGHESSSGGDPGTSAPQPSSSSPAPSAGSPSGSNSSGNVGSNNDPASAASSGSTGSSGGSNGSTGTAAPPPPSSTGTTVETPVTAAKVPPMSEAVNETVHGVDEAAVGGTLEKAGVTEVTESVVNGVAGPETPVGKTVEGATEAVGGLVGGN